MQIPANEERSMQPCDAYRGRDQPRTTHGCIDLPWTELLVVRLPPFGLSFVRPSSASAPRLPSSIFPKPCPFAVLAVPASAPLAALLRPGLACLHGSSWIAADCRRERTAA